MSDSSSKSFRERLTEDQLQWEKVRNLQLRQGEVWDEIEKLKKSQSVLTPQDRVEARALARELDIEFDEEDAAACYILLLKKKLKKIENPLETFWTRARKRGYAELCGNQEENEQLTFDHVDAYVSKLEMDRLTDTFNEKRQKQDVLDLEKARDALAEQNRECMTALVGARSSIEVLVKEKKDLEATIEKQKCKIEELDDYKSTVDTNCRKIHRSVAAKREAVKEAEQKAFDAIAENLKDLTDLVHTSRQAVLGSTSQHFHDLDTDMGGYHVKHK